MWTLMTLVHMRLPCSVILTRLNAVVNVLTELGSGTIPMELEWELREGFKMNFTEIEDHKLYSSIVDKARLQKEDFSDVKCQMLIMSCRLSMYMLVCNLLDYNASKFNYLSA